jgi:hypothetical protein
VSRREYKQRPVSFEDVCREYVKDLDLADQLTVSVLHAKVKAAFEEDKKQQADAAADGVIDFQRGWILK